MKLDVLTDTQPWYAEGLKFTCTQCGNCCTGAPGYVWISKEEIIRLAEHLGISPEETVERYCRKINGKFSLRERRNSSGSYDCIFLKEEKVLGKSAGGGKVVHTRQTCGVYPVRPLQCRTWPFWPETLASREAWDYSAKRCHGMNRGKTYSQTRIEAIRDSEDWPARPPSSSPKKQG